MKRNLTRASFEFQNKLHDLGVAFIISYAVLVNFIFLLLLLFKCKSILFKCYANFRTDSWVVILTFENTKRNQEVLVLENFSCSSYQQSFWTFISYHAINIGMMMIKQILNSSLMSHYWWKTDLCTWDLNSQKIISNFEKSLKKSIFCRFRQLQPPELKEK